MINKTTVWDIDGTILLNPLPQPDWDNPHAKHPTTGEDIYGDMPIYNSHAYLNPELQPGDLEQIRHLLTGRPESRLQLTLLTLIKYGIEPIFLHLWPQGRIYSRAGCISWKAHTLDWMNAAYYVDNDPAYRRDLVSELKQIGSGCRCISVAEWQDLQDAGVRL
ncbi:MAG: hypothetical protein O0X93_01690 [Methanocorpusculum sp.]|nr:hypothetical protein [Methanocorpusculum sp.]MDE2521857.1 hypothetical protein [Methanocorpusculum sp.]MDE2524850.1 hypothetical protein [Methanocorpusculum sp.]